MLHPRLYAKDPEKGEKIFDSIISTNPDVFIWTGDATYTSSVDGPRHSIEALENAFAKTKSTPGYARLLSVLPHKPIGVYDDHDFGVNDGGGGSGGFMDAGVVDVDERKRVFLDFMGESSSKNVYASHDFGWRSQGKGDIARHAYVSRRV